MIIRELFTKRDIPVEFLNYPGFTLDTSLFNQRKYRDTQRNGIKLSPINIIHNACIHYSGRYKNPTMRFINSFIEIIPSIGNSIDGGLYFTDRENNEFQAKSSEVLAVGICIGLTSKLFAIEKNRIGLIEGSGKRCDFSFIKSNNEYYIESKGRKGSIGNAIKSIFEKKLSYDEFAPKYGIISQLPRKNNKVKATIVDPEFIPKEINFHEEVRRLLLHYSKASYLAGFWLLGDLLRERAEAILTDVNLHYFNKNALDYGHIYKFGKVVNINIGMSTGQVFIQNNKRQYEIREDFENHIAIFLMEKKLIEILEEQDFDRLIEYHLQETVNEDDTLFSIHNDGTILAFISKKEFEQYN